MDPVKFIQTLNLANKPATAMPMLVASPGDQGKGGIVDKKAQGFVNRGALLAFDTTIPKDVKNDLLDVYSLAQMAASYSHDRYKDTENWYKTYVNVLMMVGCDIQKFNFLQYKSEQPSFQISKAVTTMIDIIAEGDQSVKDTAKKTMDSLKDADSKTVELFGSNSSSSGNGNFQIGTATTDSTGTVSIASVVAYFSADEIKRNYFFFNYSNATIKMFKSVDVFIFNTKQYARVRDTVQKKLGDSANKGISNLPDFGS